MPTCTIYLGGKLVAEGEYQLWSDNLSLSAAALGITVEQAASQLARRLAAESDQRITRRVHANLEELYGYGQLPLDTHRSRFAMLDDEEGPLDGD